MEDKKTTKAIQAYQRRSNRLNAKADELDSLASDARREGNPQATIIQNNANSLRALSYMTFAEEPFDVPEQLEELEAPIVVIDGRDLEKLLKGEL